MQSSLTNPAHNYPHYPAGKEKRDFERTSSVVSDVSVCNVLLLIILTAARNKLMYVVTMHGFRQTVFQSCRQLHVLSHDGPSETLKKKVAELEKLRRKKNRKKDQLFVEVPESRSYLDTATMPMILTAVGGALFAKLLMMYDESKSQEMIERKIKNAPPGQGTVRMLDREEWEEIKDVRPRTPFESKLARPNARIRTGEPLRMEDLKDWTIDVLTDALTRAEESVRRSSK